MSQASTRRRGQDAEAEAAAFLERRGLTIRERNVEIGGGELDLIATTDDDVPTVVFIEVRSRADDRRGRPVETVGARKRQQLRRAATAWLVARELWERVAVRFDVVGLTRADGPPIIEWIPGAFDADE
ncbi:MAG: YraN family protein [Nannocystaceae bacterium]|nr:YraN family protein [Myxococcales bacterium]